VTQAARGGLVVRPSHLSCRAIRGEYPNVHTNEN
jgi:hypothetical protein